VPGLGVVVEGVLEVKYAFQATRNAQKQRKKQAVLCTFWLINQRKRRFSLKSTSQDVLTRSFLRNMSVFKITT
jgi:hypothetical protein